MCRLKLYLWYPLFQVQWEIFDQHIHQTYSVKGHQHVIQDTEQRKTKLTTRHQNTRGAPGAGQE